jgi:hypothetical protein
MKRCCTCREEKEIIEYHKCKANKDGLQKRCKQCNSISTKKCYDNNPELKERVAKNAAEKVLKIRNQIEVIKSKYGCCLCSENDGCCLDFHHVDSESKIASVAYLITVKNLKKIYDEIKKCVIVCANCHRKIHRGNKILTVAAGYIVVD